MFSVALRAKRAFWTVGLCLTLILFSLPSYALTIQEVPNPRKEDSGWVTDMAQILSTKTEAKLNQIISELERQTGDEIAVVTVPETTPNPKAFTTKLFNYWDIGKKGVLLLVSKRDRRVEITTGYGIESLLPDAQVSDIIQKEIIPQFKQGNFEGGILAGTKSLVTKLGGNVAIDAVDIDTTANFNPQSGYVVLGILFISSLVLLSLWWFSSISRRNGFTDINSSSELGGGDSGGS
ncbi:MAG TPA: TPM domain-containing protein [Coleofasciculaceae cyanobacterium]|jgi:uncharacterized protein